MSLALHFHGVRSIGRPKVSQLKLPDSLPWPAAACIQGKAAAFFTVRRGEYKAAVLICHFEGDDGDWLLLTRVCTLLFRIGFTVCWVCNIAFDSVSLPGGKAEEHEPCKMNGCSYQGMRAMFCKDTELVLIVRQICILKTELSMPYS
ncbi:hypothetical protein YC2023_028143 [Brassica napus]|uniref:Uncharacterized protein n=1 Tax=Brassica campestris TaxID=3711 RepID=M4E2G0_BRACM